MALTASQLKTESRFQNSNGLLPYTKEIRFPIYKSQDGFTLSLDWPIIALVA